MVTARKKRPLKTGPYNKDEIDYVLLNRDRLSAQAIAEKLGRRLKTVQEIIAGHGDSTVAADNVERVIYRVELRHSERWKRVKDELTTEEMKYFEEEYIALRGQYRDDLLPSEETQVFDLIRYGVLKSRNMVERKKIREWIEKLSRRRDKLLNEDGISPSDDTEEEYVRLEAEIKAKEKAEGDRITEYTKLQERQDALMKALKSTREQRIKDIETGKDTVFGLLKLLQKEEFRQTESRQAELLRLAADREYRKLGLLHEYEDGGVDRPILSPDTVGGLAPPGGEGDDDG